MAASKNGEGKRAEKPNVAEEGIKISSKQANSAPGKKMQRREASLAACKVWGATENWLRDEQQNAQQARAVLEKG